jgi:uncharacterized protein
LRWDWDENKNQLNKSNHGLSFEAAQYVFDDPLTVSRLDPYPDEERWQTIGLIGKLTIFVVHTWTERDTLTGEETGRIISAREATSYERKAYEEGLF